MGYYIKKRELLVILLVLSILMISGCDGNTDATLITETSGQESNYSSNSEQEGWHKTAGETTDTDWTNMTEFQKNDIVTGVLASWDESGTKVVESADWFISNLDDFYSGVETQVNLAEAMSLILISGTVSEEQQQKAKKEMLEISSYEESIWQYCMDRWDYYDEIEGEYAGDKYTEQVFMDASQEFGISTQEAEDIWNKVDRAKLGLD